MSALVHVFRRAAWRYRCRHARLPWRQLEAEAARQGCSAADIFFDRAGRGANVVSGGADTRRHPQSTPNGAAGTRTA
jgi:hypothetical protein